MPRHRADRALRIAVVAENCIELVALLFATSTRGACAVIVNPRLSPRELDAIVGHAQPRCVVFVPHTADEVAAHAARHATSNVATPGLHPLALCRFDTPADAAEGSDRQVAAIVYTSGTSGRPKGVMLTHANLLFVAATSARLRGLRPADRVLGALPIYHVYGLASMLLGACHTGACLQLFEAPAALGDADDRDVQHAALHHGLQRRKNFLVGEISGRSKEDQRVARERVHLRFSTWPPN